MPKTKKKTPAMKGAKKKPKTDSGPKHKQAAMKRSPKHPGPLVSLEWMSDYCSTLRIGDKPVSLNPVSRALNAIVRTARNESLTDRPPVLKKIGRQLKAVLPPGYESVEVPISARQLDRFLRDEASVEYVQGRVKGALGPKTLDVLAIFVDRLLQKYE